MCEEDEEPIIWSTKCHCKRRSTSTLVVRALHHARKTTSIRLRAVLSSTANKGSNQLGSSEPRKLTKLELLPMELLNMILMGALDQTTTSRGLCRCSRPKSTYLTVRELSLEHRIADTRILRSTCSTFHSWAIRLVLAGNGTEETRLEVDFSDYAALEERFAASGSSPSRRLREDFPFLENSSLTLYLGNPGQVSNIQLVIDMLRRESKDTTSIFGGTSFWGLDYSYSEPRENLVDLAIEATALQERFVIEQVGPNGETSFMCHPTIRRYLQDMCIQLYHEEWLVHLDLLSIFAERASPATRVQFPTRVFEVLPAPVCGSHTFVNLLSSAENLVFREFCGQNEAHWGEIWKNVHKLLEIKHPGIPRSWDIFSQINNDITSGLHQEHTKTRPNLPPELCEAFDSVRRLEFHLGGHISLGVPLQHQGWPRLNDTFMKTFTALKFKDIVSVEVCGGFATKVTLGGLLGSLHHSSSTLKRLVYMPSDPSTMFDYERGGPTSDNEIPHHCRFLHRFPNLVNVELCCSICPAIFSCDADKPSLPAPQKRHWKIHGPQISGSACVAWKKEIDSPPPSPNYNWPKTEWCPKTLRTLLESCRAARNGDILKNVAISPVTSVRKLEVDSGKSLWELELEMRLIRRWRRGRDVGCRVYRAILRPLENPPIVMLARETNRYNRYNRYEDGSPWEPDYKLEEEELLLAWESREPWISQPRSRSGRKKVWDDPMFEN